LTLIQINEGRDYAHHCKLARETHKYTKARGWLDVAWRAAERDQAAFGEEHSALSILVVAGELAEYYDKHVREFDQDEIARRQDLNERARQAEARRFHGKRIAARRAANSPW
jgi:hypothetical protein